VSRSKKFLADMKACKEKGFILEKSNTEIPEYNSLRDAHLQHYLLNSKLRRFLNRSGLVNYTQYFLYDRLQNQEKS
jgi:hypothetical protein